MENIVVVYESRYGSTKKYAQWIAKDLGCTLIETKDATVEKLQTFDTIIYGRIAAKTVCAFFCISCRFCAIPLF